VDADLLAEEIDGSLRALAVPERAERERAYLKSELEHHGVSMPGIRGVVKAVRGRLPDLAHDEVVALVAALWAEPVHERRMASVELLGAYGHLLDRDDMPLLERFLRESRTWALVDGLAPWVVGPIVERDPVAADVLDRWSVDDDFWIRRASLLALLIPLRKGGGDFDRFTRYADTMLDEREFFIRKAIGWVLRDTARKRPDLVFEWFLPRAARASGVTLREVLKPLSEPQRSAIQAARSAR
jgi:3-methyladenine DNA glycosylase AlkD